MANTSMKLYCLAAGVFFAAAAYAQLNDPDPELWIAGYLLGGCVFNVLVMVYSGTPDASKVLLLVKVYAAANTLFLVVWAHSLFYKVEFDQSPRELAWSLMEFEEGREIGGMLLLLLHVMRLQGYLQETSHGKPSATSGLLGTLMVGGVLSGACWLWVNYQPAMNQKENMEHCNGQFSTTGLQETFQKWMKSGADDQEEL